VTQLNIIYLYSKNLAIQGGTMSHILIYQNSEQDTEIQVSFEDEVADTAADGHIV